MKKPKLTARETVMLVFLIVLLIGAIYYMGFLTPLNNEIASITAETETLQTQIDSQQEKLDQLNAMKLKVQEIEALPEDEISEMPPYDNIVPVLADLDSYLRTYSDNYNLNHTDPEPSDDGTYRRVIGLSMTCASLDDAYDIMVEVTSGRWRCQIAYFDCYPVEGNGLGGGGAINLMLSLMFFELPENSAPAEAPAA